MTYLSHHAANRTRADDAAREDVKRRTLDRIRLVDVRPDLTHVSIGHLHAGWIDASSGRRGYRPDRDALDVAGVTARDVFDRIPAEYIQA